MKGIFGTKVGMTQVFEENGRLIPVTLVKVEPNQVISVKTKEKDGYDAIQLGFNETHEKNLNKPELGQFKKANSKNYKNLEEIRGMTGHNVGDLLKVEELFQQGQVIDVQAKTKGRGFTGAIKRWNFKIGSKGHGAGYPHRFQGSVQAGRGGSQAQRVMKGKKMSGHYGHELVTIQNLSIVGFLPEVNTVMISGAIPGPNYAKVRISTSKKNPNKVISYNLIMNKVASEQAAK
ncbi:50S ribosomal protein L3 [Mycoplasma sp. T363T]|uniref:Large ribosomal subunit protein uL3 n=1 Tax=Mycoplasma bradburyae TaxID=2963128 RepID=A0AAW6HNR3_9MOLU|nr:50S ribosomal protein L3 [Mycoplasma bradburyae]MDC4163265.1 50S ribosomal protein L3 [Mycoplasma bradburyae]MDC4181879.1 50S ribosomal protein L3 [Mycoplasma bradburyae]MDC4182578.1 50S ribosomal protein L3 [Mycoplasma bradburyae]MDC4183256.1 50S ribosomal protein L3 [Mycoplasma bradburyae]UTS70178.1 50S ribosomal protein L3 [Mycoplasma bradburyae]